MSDELSIINEMTSQGFFMAIWSPGGVTDGRTYYKYERWRVHFQKGAEPAAPLYTAEGYGNGDTLLDALQEARAAALEMLK